MRRRQGRMGCLWRFLLIVVLLVIVWGAAFLYLLARPYKGFEHEVFLDFSKGTSTSEMARQLAEHGVIQDRRLFLLMRTLQPGARLQAGEYQFLHPASVWTVFDRIVRGDVFYYEVTIPEGSNMFDVAQIVEKLGFIKGADLLKIAKSPALIRDLAPHAPSLEGYLFPSTYRLTRRTSATQVCRMMTELFRRKWADVLPADKRVDVNRVVTLASIIEKETGVAAERAKVGSVYENRLRRGITLDADPTTIYAAMLDNRYRGVIHRSDLDSDNPYNTYRRHGLPPGPIANPGVASLKAALEPAATDYLFFVARPDGSGGHNFSATLAEHNLHVLEYRKGQH